MAYTGRLRAKGVPFLGFRYIKGWGFQITLIPGYTHTIFINVRVDLFVLSSIPKAQDPVVEKLYQSTEEGQKVTRNKGVKLVAVFRRIQDPYVT